MDDAIDSHTGIKHLDMPVTAANLWAARSKLTGGIMRLRVRFASKMGSASPLSQHRF